METYRLFFCSSIRYMKGDATREGKNRRLYMAHK